MRVVCAWCGELLRVLSSGSAVGVVSHGVCRWCVRCWHARVEPLEANEVWSLHLDLGGEG